MAVTEWYDRIDEKLERLGFRWKSSSEAYREVPKDFFTTQNESLIEPDPRSDFGYRLLPLDSVRDQYTLLAGAYDLVSSTKYKLERDIIARLAETIRVNDITSAVECGCGTGVTLLVLAQLFPDVRFAGYDLTPAMLERACRRLANLSLGNVELTIGSHADAAKLFKGRRFELSWAKCTAYLWPIPAIDLEGAPLPVREFILANDPTCRFVADNMASLHKILTEGAPFIEIGLSGKSERDIYIEAVCSKGFDYDAERTVCLKRYRPPKQETFELTPSDLAVLTSAELRTVVEQCALEDLVSPNAETLSVSEAEELCSTLKRTWPFRMNHFLDMQRLERTVEALFFVRI